MTMNCRFDGEGATMDDEMMQTETMVKRKEKIVKAILNGLKKQCDGYFAGTYFWENSWRPVVEKNVENAIRLEKMIVWINDKLKLLEIGLCDYCPADKSENYTKGMFKQYKETIGQWAFLQSMQTILLSPLCTADQRLNIEYAICKEYNLHYNEVLDAYCEDTNNEEE